MMDDKNAQENNEYFDKVNGKCLNEVKIVSNV